MVTSDFAAIHHHSLDLISEPDAWIEAYIRLAEKWDGQLLRLNENGGDWHARALRAEANAACFKGIAHANELRAQATQRMVDRVENSLSWKLTRPLRALKRLLRRRR